ncbi:cysteine desulfurase [Proteiniclasticum sp.]|uniref:cysteine desulfurase n=1 Tax=Proteiniclasticum sp. TaxID=2053595 RepID=UPI00289CF467|nr:cysteine desulfurase [Proteiniclasticum sp.]
MSNLRNFREDFPILNEEVNGRKIIYFDSAATSQRPNQVLEAVLKYDHEANGNPHRGSHTLSMRATEAFEQVREKVRKFIGAKSTKEIIFTKNATEAINLVAYSYALNNLLPGDKIVITIAEHHANLVTWQQIAKKTKAELVFMYVDPSGRLPLGELHKIDEKTKIVACTHMSNVLGSIFPIEKVIERGHQMGAKVLIDGAQAVAHMPVDVSELDADFYVFSGHKMYSLMGVGVLYGKEEILDKMEPFLYGGDMIEYVYEEETSFNELPFKFEAGTQGIESVVSLGAAIDYLEEVTFEYIHEREMELTAYALSRLKELPYIRIIGPEDMNDRGAVISFVVEDIHPHDVSSILDNYGVGIRAGHHCAQPLLRYLEVFTCSRASFAFYNTKEEIDVLVDNLSEVRRWMGYGSR